MCENYSVLMSVYFKEKPEYLRESMESILRQTVKTNDFVLVCDGPLNEELDNVIDEMKSRMGSILHVVRLPQNAGLGYALHIGIKECRNEIVARMDSDDISRPERCEKEFAVLKEHPEISIVGGWIEEFETTTDKVRNKRVVPETCEEIIAFSKKRNPFNHPSVMYRKSAVMDAGNYEDIRYMQDYYLWISMLIKGYKGWNIQEPLVWMRADSNLFKRRSGKLYMDIQVGLFKRMLKAKYITFPQFCSSVIMRSCSSMAPNWARKYMFKHILRK